MAPEGLPETEAPICFVESNQAEDTQRVTQGYTCFTNLDQSIWQLTVAGDTIRRVECSQDPKKIDQVLNRSLDERSSSCLSDALPSGTATGGVMTPLSSARKGLLSHLSDRKSTRL